MKSHKAASQVVVETRDRAHLQELEQILRVHYNELTFYNAGLPAVMPNSA